MKSKEPSGSMRRRSSDTRLMKVPSFFHSMRAGAAASLCAEQLSRAEFPLMTRVSWGSTVNQKGLKGCAAEPDGATGGSGVVRNTLTDDFSPHFSDSTKVQPLKCHRFLWYIEILTETYYWVR